ncbi:MAG: hypothetical protein EP330_19945 [Deltaproteobacteria bacterium]|nr:MAG: hypothetical protein EP330_19945 [Deltaproteobacteria bacterium]
MLLLSLALAFAEPPAENPHGPALVAEAERYLGIPYAFASEPPRTMNCLNLVYEPYRTVFREKGVAYEVDPIAMIHDRHLGEPVPGLSPVLRADLDAATLARLQPGDLVYFLVEGYDEGCPRCRVTTIDGKGYGGWHTAMSAGGAAIVHAKPGGVVSRDTLDAVAFDALWVSRRVR